MNDQQRELAHELGRRMFLGEMSLSAARQSLLDKVGGPASSGEDILRWYRAMREGTTPKRNLSLGDFDYFVTRMASESGAEGLSAALTAIRAHIRYREELNKVGQPGLRRLHDRHAKTLLEMEARRDPQSLSAFLAMRSDDEARAMRLPVEELRRRIAAADPLPRKVLVTTEVFQRDPHVVAQVLLKAAGHCHRCGHAAPFTRRDGSPYLEVHHLVPLSEGGQDTVENTVALCPNCHRQQHHGTRDL